jgi:hypothetical protein
MCLWGALHFTCKVMSLFFLGLLKEKWEAFGLRLNHAQQQMKMTENALLFAFVEVFYL